ncbi:hypothetical protein ACFX5Q_19615 [Mesorhizobium sp. IMUNJ 23033]|uniref:hypothetical protein n=1 Tax=Mesorhizobium sp. IMUNJ 23033 TaxID=3378039 RepID=UPI0038505083
MAKWRWAVFPLMCSTITAQANFFSGNDLHDFCTGSPLFARGYIMGVADLNDLNLGGVDLSGQTFLQRKFICVPQGVTGQQAGDVQVLGGSPGREAKSGGLNRL